MEEIHGRAARLDLDAGLHIAQARATLALASACLCAEASTLGRCLATPASGPSARNVSARNVSASTGLVEPDPGQGSPDSNLEDADLVPR